LSESRVCAYLQENESKHRPFNSHPENPQRIKAILDFLQGESILEKVERRKGREAQFDEVSLAHTEKYLSSLQRFCEKGGGFLDLDTYASEHSFKVALSACGTLIQAVDDALKEKLNAFCLVRPPGHHALSDKAMGFCLINNVAVAALYAYNAGFEKVAILDWDAHHGNGTQEILYTQPILFISFHQSPHYPGTGKIKEVGFDKGKGFTFNFPFPPGTGSSAYHLAFEEVVMPLFEVFKPDLILVSAGFDSHILDPLSSLSLHESDYYYFTRSLMSLPSSSIILSLEGGYDLGALSLSVWHCFRAFLREEVSLKSNPSRLGEEVVIEVKSVVREYWDI
jgi:acetoin utilization deacetylase AcuC-like enzyme